MRHYLVHSYSRNGNMIIFLVIDDDPEADTVNPCPAVVDFMMTKLSCLYPICGHHAIDEVLATKLQDANLINYTVTDMGASYDQRNEF